MPAPDQSKPRTEVSMLDRLAEYIDKTLDEPEPVAPTLQQPRPFTGWEAAAGALNPQLIPFLSQRAGQQSELANQSATAGYQGQVRRREQALGLAGNVALAQNKTSKERYIVVRNGKRYVVRDILDPHGNTIDQEVLGEAPESTAFLPSSQGFFPASRQSGQVTGGALQAPGGGTIYPAPPAGTVANIAKGTATLGGIDEMESAYNEIRSYIQQQDQGLVSQYIGGTVGGTKYGGPLAPAYATYAAKMNQALNNYVLAVTGQQFSDAALRRYESQFPQPWDPEDVARIKIEAVKQRAVADMQAQIRAFPGAGGAAPQSSTPQGGGPTIRRSQLLRLPPEDASETEADARRRGITIIEDSGAQ